jgi:hypothetical protein
MIFGDGDPAHAAVEVGEQPARPRPEIHGPNIDRGSDTVIVVIEHPDAHRIVDRHGLQGSGYVTLGARVSQQQQPDEDAQLAPVDASTPYRYGFAATERVMSVGSQ